MKKRIVYVLLFCVAALGGYMAAATSRLLEKQEVMTVGEASVNTFYTPAASADDLCLPFYPGAEVVDSFRYRMESMEGEKTLCYACATLRTEKSIETVSEWYASELPGNPQAGEITDAQGRRYVLAVAVGSEVRMVTIRPHGEGAEIVLVRASEPVIPRARTAPAPRESESFI